MNAENNSEGGGGEEGDCWWSVVAGDGETCAAQAGDLMGRSPD
jgi:hypothetical protein